EVAKRRDRGAAIHDRGQVVGVHGDRDRRACIDDAGEVDAFEVGEQAHRAYLATRSAMSMVRKRSLASSGCRPGNAAGANAKPGRCDATSPGGAASATPPSVTGRGT